MTGKVGDKVSISGIYWCSVCKRPERFAEGNAFPECKNFCGRCRWELVEKQAQPAES